MREELVMRDIRSIEECSIAWRFAMWCRAVLCHLLGHRAMVASRVACSWEGKGAAGAAFLDARQCPRCGHTIATEPLVLPESAARTGVVHITHRSVWPIEGMRVAIDIRA